MPKVKLKDVPPTETFPAKLAGSRTIRIGVSVLGLSAGALLAASPAAAVPCEFAPTREIHIDVGIEPQLLIDATCTDPVYNEDTFVVTNTEAKTFEMPDGTVVPFTEVTGHFPAAATPETLPEGVRQSPTLFRQDYVFRFPAREFWQNRSFQQQHPTGGGVVDNHLAFVNGAFSIDWMSASIPNAVATHRHQAAATKFAWQLANEMYDNEAPIYSYFWGCSGGGVVSQAAAENVTGVWAGVQPQCTGTSVDSQYHSFLWQAHYTMAIPQEKRSAIAAAAAAGGTDDIYAGLNDEETAVLNEFIAAGYPLEVIGRHFTMLTPLIDPVDIRVADPTYEDDFWSQPGYAGANPPEYLQAAFVDGWATITSITRDADGNPVSIQFDPDTLPALGTTGDNYLEYWVYDGDERVVDQNRPDGVPTGNKSRFSLIGNLDYEAGTLSLSGTIPQIMGPPQAIANSPVLLGHLEEGDRLRVNNRFILAMYFYPRHTVIDGIRSHDQYRDADGSPIYPQRASTDHLYSSNYRTMGGRVETGDIRTKTMIMEGMGDNLSWPIFNASYAQRIEHALGPDKAEDMMRFFLHDNGNHSTGGGEPGIFRQSIADLIAWAEDGVAPPQSTQYSIENGQVVMAATAAERHGLQPVLHLQSGGGDRVVVGANEPVNIEAEVEMPPRAGEIVKYSWKVGDGEEDETVLADPPMQIAVVRTVSFAEPGEYVVRFTVHGQRDGLVEPADQTLLRNFDEVRVIVQ